MTKKETKFEETKLVDIIYQNTSKVNVFTTKGRVGANEIIELSEDEGEITKGLERV